MSDRLFSRKRIRILSLGAVFFLAAVQSWAQLDQLKLIEAPRTAIPSSDSVPFQAVPLQQPLAELTALPSPVVFSGRGTASFEMNYSFPEGFHQTMQEEFFFVTSPGASPFVVLNIIYPEGGLIEDGILSYYGSASLIVELGLFSMVTPGEYRVPFTAGYQLCDDAGTCYFPQEAVVEVVLTVPEEIEIPAVPTVSEGSSGRISSSGPLLPGTGTQTQPIGATALLRFLLFAFLGGLFLNVMPCVLPVLSIRALNLVNQSGNKRGEIFTGSLFYTAGILVSLLILAGAVIALKLSGELVGWGFQFQNPLFVVFLITVVFVFALSLFDVYVFQAPVMNGAALRASQKGYIGSFFNGIIAVLLATPCTAPLLGTALGFAFSQPPFMIIGIFTMVGLGFALPFLLIGIWPAAIQKLPKPGAWMNTFKELMGFVLLATVVYLLSILRFQINSAEMIRVILFLLVLGFLLWIYGKTAKPTAGTKRKWIILALFIILSVSAAGRLLQFEGSIETIKNDDIREGWEIFSPEALDKYRQSNEPVLVVFSAKWCTVCKLNEQAVLHTERADKLFGSLGIHVLYGDYTNQDDTIGGWIQSFGRAGVPVYAFYPPGESFRLLPEVLSMQVLESYLQTPSS